MDLNFAFLMTGDYGAMLVGGALMTLRLFAASWVCGFAVALILVALRGVPFKPFQWLLSLFIEYHRNVPTVVQIMVWYFGMPQILPREWRIWLNQGDSEFMFAMIALALNVSAFMAQDILSGVKATAHAQNEAARSIGLNAIAALRHVILPQAIRVAVPPLVNRSLILFKDTSLAMVIGVTELTYQVRAIENVTFRSFEVFAIATALYLIAAMGLMALGATFARRFPADYRS